MSQIYKNWNIATVSKNKWANPKKSLRGQATFQTVKANPHEKRWFNMFLKEILKELMFFFRKLWR